ncbi:MAG: hypothetical protein K6F44_05250 [Lachnospiraceae bacterium]|nr:hypothetical protein [Lachnospiraceae bacterium]
MRTEKDGIIEKHPHIPNPEQDGIIEDHPPPSEYGKLEKRMNHVTVSIALKDTMEYNMQVGASGTGEICNKAYIHLKRLQNRIYIQHSLR